MHLVTLWGENFDSTSLYEVTLTNANVSMLTIDVL